MARFRCYNAECTQQPDGRLGFDFGGETRVCPKCGHDGNLPEWNELVIQLVDVHLIVADKAGPLVTLQQGRRRIVCAPAQANVGDGHPDFTHVTGDVLCVTCEACKATPAFAAASVEQRVSVRAPSKGDKLAAVATEVQTAPESKHGN